MHGAAGARGSAKASPRAGSAKPKVLVIEAMPPWKPPPPPMTRDGAAPPARPPVQITPAGWCKPGARAFHQKFGFGTVVAIEEDRVAVDFAMAGSKRLLARFLEPG